MLKVVVLDANAISRNLLTSVLVGGGYEVVGDANVSSAGIASMLKLRPQLVCIDIGGTDDAAFGKVDMVREGLPKALIFLVSAKFSAEAIQDALARGVHGFIVKPFNGQTVMATIRKTVIQLAKRHRFASSENAES